MMIYHIGYAWGDKIPSGLALHYMQRRLGIYTRFNSPRKDFEYITRITENIGRVFLDLTLSSLEAARAFEEMGRIMAQIPFGYYPRSPLDFIKEWFVIARSWIRKLLAGMKEGV